MGKDSFELSKSILTGFNTWLQEGFPKLSPDLLKIINQNSEECLKFILAVHRTRSADKIHLNQIREFNNYSRFKEPDLNRVEKKLVYLPTHFLYQYLTELKEKAKQEKLLADANKTNPPNKPQVNAGKK